MSKQERKKEKQTPATASEPICPICGHLNLIDDDRHERCGKPDSANSADAQNATLQPQDDTKRLEYLFRYAEKYLGEHWTRATCDAALRNET